MFALPAPLSSPRPVGAHFSWNRVFRSVRPNACGVHGTMNEQNNVETKTEEKKAGREKVKPWKRLNNKF